MTPSARWLARSSRSRAACTRVCCVVSSLLVVVVVVRGRIQRRSLTLLARGVGLSLSSKKRAGRKPGIFFSHARFFMRGTTIYAREFLLGRGGLRESRIILHDCASIDSFICVLKCRSENLRHDNHHCAESRKHGARDGGGVSRCRSAHTTKTRHDGERQAFGEYPEARRSIARA